MSEILKNILVVDLGSNLTKIGFNNEILPRSVFPTLLNSNLKSIGYESYLKNNSDIDDSIVFPVHHGIIKHWDEFEVFMEYIFNKEYEVNSKDQRMLLSESPFNTNDNKRRLNEIMFEKFNLSELNLSPTNKLTLYSTGNTTGTVVECGGGLCYSIPVYEEGLNRDPIQLPHYHLEFGGHQLTSYMKTLLQKNSSIPSRINITYEYAREIKEKLGYLSLNFKDEINNPPQFKPYILPDGNTLEIGSERFCCPEPLFHPLLLNYNSMGIHKIIYDSILKVDEQYQKSLFEKIILGGGSTLFDGFKSRLTLEINNLITSTPSSSYSNINIIAQDNRNLSAWIGGSIKGSSDTIFKSNLITKKQYEEIGENSVNLNIQQ